MSRAEELFARIKAGGAAEIHAMIKATVVEELFLDYKQSSTMLPGTKLSPDDRKNLAKCVAGFANSDGGVIVWGVTCKPTPDGDVPTHTVPISSPIALKALFDGALSGLTLPAHSGVENLSLSDTSGVGFVITHVPPGTHVPYQALYPKPEYYIRAGSSFQPTPHAVLAGMFGRVPQPVVAPVIRFGAAGRAGDGQVQVRLDVSVVNRGRGFAEDIFCTIEADTPKPGSGVVYAHGAPMTWQRWRNIRDGRDCFTMLLKEIVVPPGTEREALTIHLELTQATVGEYTFTVAFGCKGGPGAAQTVTFPSVVIENAYVRYAAENTAAVLRNQADEELKKCLPVSA